MNPRLPSVEQLESRIVFTASGTAVLDAGVLNVQGTAENDVIVISETATDFVVRANFLDSARLFPKNEVDSIVAKGDGGDDTLVASLLSMNVTLRGGTGDDRLFGGSEADLIQGGGGNDILYGNSGDDRIFGGDGHDLIFGGAGDDIVVGDAGVDALFGEAGRDRILGGNDRDRIFGGADDDRLVGGSGNDQIAGGLGDDMIFGDDRFDNLKGDGGNDRIFPGDQTLIFDPAAQCENLDVPERVLEIGRPTNNIVLAGGLTITLPACDPTRHDATLENLSAAQTKWTGLEIESYKSPIHESILGRPRGRL